MQKRQIIAIVSIVVTVFIIGILFWWFQGKQSNEVVAPSENRGVQGSTIDVTLDFYESWLSARRSTTTDPYKQDLANSAALSLVMSQKLIAAEPAFRDNGFDPVLCQSSLPEKLRSKPIFEQDKEAQILVFPGDKQSGVQAVVNLVAHDGFWEITGISCGSAEQASEQGEFTFEQDGFLLKEHVPSPLDSQYWHLVFEQEGTPGYTVPLFLSKATCVLEGGTEETCRDDMFTETMRVRVKGDMTEAGAEVKRIEFLK